MRKPLTLTPRKWMGVALLSVMVPIGLLVTFRLVGVLQEPPKPKTMTVETVGWNMSRPRGYVAIDEKVENSYSDSVASVKWTVHISSYTDNSKTFGDYLHFRISAVANLSNGHIQSVVVRFSQ